MQQALHSRTRAHSNHMQFELLTRDFDVIGMENLEQPKCRT